MHPAETTAHYVASVLWGLVVMGTTLLVGRVLIDAAARRVQAWLHRGEL